MAESKASLYRFLERQGAEACGVNAAYIALRYTADPLEALRDLLQKDTVSFLGFQTLLPYHALPHPRAKC